ncbi:MAG: ferredoxin [Gammaproteobacteria bacterium]|nr:ferredoxin [Gammaproteobacteria bacterium]
MTLPEVEAAAGAARLSVLGGFHPAPDEGLGRTLMLLSPGPAFWPHFTQSPEMRDGAADPLDRWSRRVVSRMADVLGARALFPFGPAPFHPFLSWATRTGRIWPSPVNFLVHGEQGLWVSFRGALAFEALLDVPPAMDKPCDSCADQPCRSACPVSALTPAGYDVASCKEYLRGGADCMSGGCAVRAACPVSRSFPRDARQSAFHMAAFL